MGGQDTRVIVIAPGPNTHGRAFKYIDFPRGNVDYYYYIIYLSPELEKLGQERVNVTIAHEIADAILEHGPVALAGTEIAIEKEADELITEWGYRVTNSEHWKLCMAAQSTKTLG